MIKQIRLQNFQGHVDTTIDFSEGVNSFIGKSDSGKTSCIRALKWVLTNRPSGESFINHNAFNNKGKQVKPCIVTITTNKHVVERERSATINSYTIDNVSLKAIGTDVPEEVLEALNMNDINIQYQLDAPFLLTETSGEVARILNRVVKLDDIDFTLKQLNSYAKKLSNEKKNIEYQIESTDAELNKLDITEIEKTVEIGEMIEDSLNSTLTTIQSLKDNLHEIDVLNDILSQSTTLEECDKLLEKAKSIYNEYTTTIEKASLLDTLVKEYNAVLDIINDDEITHIDFAKIDKLLDEYNKLDKDITKLSSLIDVYNNLELDNPIIHIDFSTIDKTIANYKETQSDITTLRDYIYKYKEATKDLEAMHQELHELTDEVYELVGDTCPVCGHKIEELQL